MGNLVVAKSSPSPFTWPPTQFDIELTCRITDNAENLVLEAKVNGTGAAEFEEFKNDFSLSAKRSTEDLLTKLQTLLLNSPELRK